jgi:hypothetical protein
MKLRNLSSSKQEFSTVCKKTGKMIVEAVLPGAELEVREDHPEQVKKLHINYPKDWVAVEEKKLSKAELQAEMKKRDEEEAAEKKKAEAEAKAAAKAEKKAE